MMIPPKEGFLRRHKTYGVAPHWHGSAAHEVDTFLMGESVLLR